jgi:uncharacterized protein with ATP-grasp and redox domains
MQTYLDCYPCLLRQALQAARFAGANDAQQKVVLDRVLDVLGKAGLTETPPEVAARVHEIVRQEVDDGDPYRSAKERSTQEALALYPRLTSLATDADDPLETALRLAIAGNIIDFGAVAEYDLWGTVERVLAQPFTIDDGAALRKALDSTHEVLYLGDNAGETVFDRVLIETLDVPVVYAVKGGAALNDATREDAEAAGLDKVATVVDNGASTMGTILSRCSGEFRRRFAAAELVIAKGQANYETLSEKGSKVFFLLQAKCPVIARDMGVEVGSILLEQGR